MQKLPLADMASRHPGLTPAVSSFFEEAAKVCLDRHHTSPVTLQINDDGTATDVTMEWEGVDERMRRAWANDIDRTEYGAYGLTIAAVELSRGFVAISRAEIGTGADYYVSPTSPQMVDLEDAIRLEISGVDAGPAASVNERLRVKVHQLQRGRGNLPALAGVVGFRAKLIALEHVKL